MVPFFHMQDRLFEESTFPRALPWQKFQRPLVFAPHPDDEVFGCGGLLALWASVGVRAKVIVLTSGQAQGIGSQRQSESRAAASVLGHEVAFWDLPDRGVRCSQVFMHRLSSTIQAADADLVLVPALHEPHPDHQATSLAVLWSLSLLPSPVDLCFYESGTALVHCTHLVDISAVEDRKLRAMQAFASQEQSQPYASRITALNHFRALTLGPTVHSAEGFHWVNLAGSDWACMLPALDPLFLHARGQAVIPSDLPLVSVLLPTHGSQHLEQAVASVRAQTYPRIELLVTACTPETSMPVWWNTLAALLPTRWLESDTPRTPTQAVHTALANATGSLCLCLDEREFLAPDHIDSLVHALLDTPGAQAAYSTTEAGNGSTLPSPMHVVLFARSLHEALNVTPSTPGFEQDFWLRISMCTRADFAETSVSTLSRSKTPPTALQATASDPHPDTNELAQIRAQLHAIETSRAWRLIQRLRHLKNRLTRALS